ncbi:biotin/lipoyl-containing protein [Aestuariicoccus sp. MJ-SS9]|uniref:biotin/lipoyl-containing protein n=1 Tax=Aestuariicoccus sp. MJ-SS9 TaxID=3079855 RepID=UPI00290D4A2E|nr:biotin/lipoyl-containing protein [Aestuariicoccus sp. MJ-SS9]MDU8911410.1 biotin/lipoyl-containing protein [Aestuariicoccus sp. MJ-SS9]
MPLDVIMPALGMAQETGVIVTWHKKPGDAVAEGDVLFEVETDKATMEVEAQGAGFLSGVSAGEGDEVPVGNVIARITDSAEPDAAPSAAAGDPPTPDGGGSDLPEGAQIIMPTLGMAQDSGLLVGWLAKPGDKVGADDPLFEVETDKSTMEVPAGAEGYLAACLARAGEDVPTGQVIAILTAEAPSETIERSALDGGAPAPAPAAEAPAEKAPAAKPAPAAKAAPVPAPATGGKILASPKAKRLALEQGLDLGRLVAEGVPQPYHVADIETLKHLPAEAAPAAGATPAAASLHLTAELPAEGFTAFAAWAADAAGLKDAGALLAGLGGACLPGDAAIVAVEAAGRRRLFSMAAGPLAGVTETDDATPDLVVRDLRLSRITGLRLGAEAAPVLSLTSTGSGVALTLECAPGQLRPEDALSLISDFAGRLEQPLRHLL